MRPGSASSSWAGIPDPEEAGPAVIAAYLGAYGPATSANFHNWLARGWIGARRARARFTALGDRLTDVEVDGERRLIRADVVRPARARSSRSVTGTWELVGDEARVAWFREAPKPRTAAVEAAVAQHAAIAERALRSVVSFV